MTAYIATISHHSISRAREIGPFASLASAKRAATREFGQEQVNYTILIYGFDDGYPPYPVSSRRVADRMWS